MTDSSEKSNIFKEFFNIRGNEQTDDLLTCKERCIQYLVENDDKDVQDLINVIDAEITYFKEDDKDKAREYVLDLWYRLCNKENLTFNEIRILNIIMFIAPSLEKVIETAEDLCIQLEGYKHEKDYIRLMSVIKLNLANILFNSKHFDASYKSYYDEMILQLLDEIIGMNIKTRNNDKYIVALSCIKRGALLKDKNLIYCGTLLLKEIEVKEVSDLIKVYIKNYNIDIGYNLTN